MFPSGCFNSTRIASCGVEELAGDNLATPINLDWQLAKQSASPGVASAFNATVQLWWIGDRLDPSKAFERRRLWRLNLIG